MQPFSVSRLVESLCANDLASQVEALDRFFSLPTGAVSNSERRDVMTASVKALEASSNPYPIAERVVRFGPDAIPLLVDLLNRSKSAEVKTLVALILVNNGSHVGVPVLVQEIERGGSYDMIASLALSNAGITDHAQAVIERLRECPVPPVSEFPATEDEVILGLIKCLKRLQIPLPTDLRSKFSAPNVSQFFREAVT